jgi:hypothetical protein
MRAMKIKVGMRVVRLTPWYGIVSLDMPAAIQDVKQRMGDKVERRDV